MRPSDTAKYSLYPALFYIQKSTNTDENAPNGERAISTITAMEIASGAL